jgi:hypothetical protein
MSSSCARQQQVLANIHQLLWKCRPFADWLNATHKQMEPETTAARYRLPFVKVNTGHKLSARAVRVQALGMQQLYVHLGL